MNGRTLRLGRLARYSCVGAPVVLLFAGVVWLGRGSTQRDLESAARNRPAPAWQEPRLASVEGVRILQFYATPAVLKEGDRALMCYGVVNAQAVRVDPTVESLNPSLNRCIEIRPPRNTEYTLTATGDDGHEVTASLFIAVRPDPEQQPRIVEFAVHGSTESQGRTIYQLCFRTRNARQVTLDPPVIPSTSAPFGCFFVSPQQPTVYTLTVTGREGRVTQRRVSVGDAPPAA